MRLHLDEARMEVAALVRVFRANWPNRFPKHCRDCDA